MPARSRRAPPGLLRSPVIGEVEQDRVEPVEVDTVGSFVEDQLLMSMPQFSKIHG